MLHNQILVVLEKVLAHLCRCSKAAKNSLRGVWAKEAACENAWHLKSMGQIATCRCILREGEDESARNGVCGSGKGAGKTERAGSSVCVWQERKVRRIGEESSRGEEKKRPNSRGPQLLFTKLTAGSSSHWEEVCVSCYTNPHMHMHLWICVGVWGVDSCWSMWPSLQCVRLELELTSTRVDDSAVSKTQTVSSSPLEHIIKSKNAPGDLGMIHLAS